MNHTITMKQLALSDRPYEILERNGASSLTDAQLLAVLIQSGSADENALQLAMRLLSDAADSPDASDTMNPLNTVMHYSYQKLIRYKGIGKIKALKFQAICELCCRIHKTVSAQSVFISSAEDVSSLFMDEMKSLKQEIVKVVYLNHKNKVLFDSNISKGNICSSVVSPREIFIPALEKGASKVILIHNHPSGDPTPSQADIQMTKKLFSCGELMEIRVLDHIIIGQNKFYSMKETGLI